MKRLIQLSIPLTLLLVVLLSNSCKKEEILDVISGFSYQVDPVDYKRVTFTNASANYSKVSWDFGDGSALSSEEDPIHSYAVLGSYTVTLTATSTDGKSTDKSSQTVTISDPDAELTKLVGDVSKSWILLREVATGVDVYPLEVGPIDRSTIWWAQGRGNDELANRPCILNDEFIFSRDGAYEYKTNGDFWAEAPLFAPSNICQETTPANLVGPAGEDQSAWGDGVHTFSLVTGSSPILTVIGQGAFIGLAKIGTNEEVFVPQPSVTYDIVKLTEGTVDTLVLESKYNNDADVEDDAYWRITLVSYDNPGDIPVLPGPKPVASFTAELNGFTLTCTNTTTNSSSFVWDFGDGNTSTAQNPTHTYAGAGLYTVTLNAFNPNGENSASKNFWVDPTDVTEADLQGGSWKVRVGFNSVVVGPGMGDPSWWQVPLAFLDGSSGGADDWSCMTNDEFIFGAGGVYQYKTNGDARNDGYMGSPNGCISDAQLASSGNGAAFGSNTHSYTFTPASGPDRAIITLTNGPTGAAFLGFYKGYYGGENSDGANPPNGGNATNKYEVIAYAKGALKEYLYVSVDTSTGHDGSTSWSAVLER